MGTYQFSESNSNIWKSRSTEILSKSVNGCWKSGLAKFSDDADTDVESQIIPEYNEAETDADDDDDDDDADDQG